MLLPNISQPITPGAIGLPFDTMNPQSINNQLMRAMRQTRGFSAYELTIGGSEQKASVLSSFAGLSKEDSQDEGKLSAALDRLLVSIMDTIDETVASYPEEDWPILTTIAARSLKHSLADAIRRTVEQADAQLAELRKEANAA